ncbi:hypothetical protein C0V77_03210 [Emticicia sp. TH156]|nr:hypothetical protein C0V77_03210 [Emticicia sp. TH156]
MFQLLFEITKDTNLTHYFFPAKTSFYFFQTGLTAFFNYCKSFRFQGYLLRFSRFRPSKDDISTPVRIGHLLFYYHLINI